MKITFITNDATVIDGGSAATVNTQNESLTIKKGESLFIFSRWSTSNGGRTYQVLPGTHCFEGNSRDFERFVSRNWNPFRPDGLKIVHASLQGCVFCCEWEDSLPTEEQIDELYDSWPA